MPLIPDKDSRDKVSEHQIAKLGPLLKPKLSQQEIATLKNVLNKGARFYIVATQILKDMIVQGSSPILNKLNPMIIQTLLLGNGIRVDSEMILNWMEGKLDASNSLVLSYCEIRVEGYDFAIKADLNKQITTNDVLIQDSDKDILKSREREDE